MNNNLANIKKSKFFLDKGHCVAVPTETVYGLAGNAYSDNAVKRIFKLKKRPRKNPLIVHYLNLNQLKNDCEINQYFILLFKKLCPGPITFVLKLKKQSKISKYVTNNKKTLAVRFPKHTLTRNLLKKLNYPIAAPSANISTNISAVSLEDVKDEFGKKIKFILNGGRSKIGLESTVVSLYGKTKVLRPGAISHKKIGKVLKENISILKKTKELQSPGLLKRHYSPGIPIKLNCKKTDGKSAFIVFGKKYKKARNVFNLSRNGNLKEAAKNLYKTLRKIKNLKYKKINVVKIPNYNIGIAINDRLRRASH